MGASPPKTGISASWYAAATRSRRPAGRVATEAGVSACVSATLGPWLVTADEFEPYRDAGGFLTLDMRVSINGAMVGQDLLSNMGWPFEDLVSYASRGTWVRAGDVLGSGTCGNGGRLAELWGRRGRIDPPPLRPGDVVGVTVEGIGTIRNTVIPDLPPVRPARPRPRTRKRTP
jgi:2-keto-4-pentenoate hydratase/2-oxohepta-3-ene-1,7-dioic acid hydratase in catechol pathway